MVKWKTLIALVGVLLLFGCGGEGEKASPGSKKSVKPKKVTKKTVAAPSEKEAEEDVSESEYSYNPVGKRDPFRSLLDIQRPVESEQEEPLTPLQKFGVEQLRLLGSIIGLEEPKAMVVAPDGKSYILRVGTKVGKNNGTVIGITPEGILVEERYYDFSGDVNKKVRNLNLPKQEGVK